MINFPGMEEFVKTMLERGGMPVAPLALYSIHHMYPDGDIFRQRYMHWCWLRDNIVIIHFADLEQPADMDMDNPSTSCPRRYSEP